MISAIIVLILGKDITGTGPAKPDVKSVATVLLNSICNKVSCVINELNFNSNDYKFACDFDFYIKILSNTKYRSCYLDNYTSKHRIAGASSKNLSTMISANNEAYKSWKNNGIKVSIFFLIKKPFLKIKEFF